MLRFTRIFTKCTIKSNVKCYSSQKRQYKEVSVKVPWGHVTGKWWEPYDTRPILSLHGWQDNCATFDRLIPMLNKNVGFLAIDFPGHGHSSKLPPGVTYDASMYLITILSLIDYFKWPKISLMGHSLGGITSYTFTMFYPEDVDFVLCLDGAKPMIAVNKYMRVATALKKFLQYNSYALSPDEPPSHDLIEMRKKVCSLNNNSVSPEVVDILLERNIQPSNKNPGKYYYTLDQRLKSFEFLLLSQDDLLEFAQYFIPPIFIAKFQQGSYYEAKENFYQVLDVLKRTSKDCSFHYVPGTHHAHLNNPENVAGLLTDFIRTHDIEDRSIGSLTDEIVIEKPQLVLSQENY